MTAAAGAGSPTPQEAAAAAVAGIWNAVDGGARTTIVDSPPGAGKSTLVRDISGRLVAKLQQVPIVVQTNNQADDMVAAFLRDNNARAVRGEPPLRVARLHRATGWVTPTFMSAAGVLTSKDVDDLGDADVIVAPAAKWARSTGSWPLVIIDEAYQMSSDDLLRVAPMAQRLLAVGDPGQVDPFTTVDAAPFRTMELSPISPAAHTLVRTQPYAAVFALPVSWRLTPAAAQLVSAAFYRQPFVAGTAEGERWLAPTNEMLPQPVRATVRQVCVTGWAHLELPAQLMPDNDPDVATHLAQSALGLLDAAIDLHAEDGAPRRLTAGGIAIGVAHNSQVNAVRAALHRLSRERGQVPPDITVDTANGIQGREFDVTLVWHPLSGRRDTSEFHLDAGRLCVLLSRHRYGCIVVSRAGIAEQLATSPSSDDHYPDTDLGMDGWLAQVTALEILRPHVVPA